MPTNLPFRLSPIRLDLIRETVKQQRYTRHKRFISKHFSIHTVNHHDTSNGSRPNKASTDTSNLSESFINSAWLN